MVNSGAKLVENLNFDHSPFQLNGITTLWTRGKFDGYRKLGIFFVEGVGGMVAFGVNPIIIYESQVLIG